MDNRAIVTHAFEELAKGNTAPYVAAMAESFTWRPMGHGAWGKVFAGKEHVRRDMFGKLYAQYEGAPRTQWTAIHADGDHVIVEANGTAVTKAGKDYNNRYCFIIRMEDGKMVEVREYLDTALAQEVIDGSVFL
jgi:ketosteroid isomerase-like protein